MPLMIVWPLSWSVATRKDGSSAASRDKATPIFSWSALVLGSTATSMTGSGNSMRSSTIGFWISHSVSPVVEYLSPASARMSPARASLMSSRWFACICSMRPMRSRSSLTEFSTCPLASSTPE